MKLFSNLLFMPQRIFLSIIALLFPMILFAHGSHGNGVMAGFTHPIFGLDHAVTIVGIGALAYFKNKSKWYLLFLPFLAAMIVGGFLGIGNEATFAIEKFIASSVLITGLFILAHDKLSTILLSVILALFGFAHGYAHGAEMPETTTSLQYISGYTLGAILMAVIGMFFTKLLNSTSENEEKNVSLLGGIVIGCAVVILLG